MSYEKEKRKNEDAPSLFWALLQGLWRYVIVLPLQGTWWQTRQIARGTWWATKNAFQISWAACSWAVQVPLRIFMWMWHLIMGLPPEFETQRETNIYRMIRRRYRRRNFFALHTLAYSLGLFASAVAVISILRNSSILRFDPYPGVSSTAAFAFVWSVIWIFHLLHKQSGDNEDRDLNEALEREYTRSHRKPKAQPVYKEEYTSDRLTEEYEPSGNHSAAYYEDEDGYTSIRKR